mmetsp:Transcript_55439/g.104104  ORF Transcript_55439/g.104104 Transcript_55439/m.104104 type:complete len:218 (+) Transcript_55439:79-732(+)
MLRPARPTDGLEIARVYLATWSSHGHNLLRTGKAPEDTQTFDDEVQRKQQCERFTSFIESGQRHFIVAEHIATNRLCAFISYGPSYSREGFGEVMQLFVHPDFQRQGMGVKLLQAAWNQLRCHSWSRLGCHVWCTLGNPANRVYERIGWFRTGKKKSLVPTLSKEPVDVEEYQAPDLSFGSSRIQSWSPWFLLGLAVGIVAVLSRHRQRRAPGALPS